MKNVLLKIALKKEGLKKPGSKIKSVKKLIRAPIKTTIARFASLMKGNMSMPMKQAVIIMALIIFHQIC